MKVRFIVTRDTPESVAIEVEGSSLAEAREKVLHVADSGDIENWEMDEGSPNRAYLGDPDDYEIIDPPRHPPANYRKEKESTMSTESTEQPKQVERVPGLAPKEIELILDAAAGGLQDVSECACSYKDRVESKVQLERLKQSRRLIVRACNSHGPLVEALRAVLDVIDLVLPTVIWKQADAALALATTDPAILERTAEAMLESGDLEETDTEYPECDKMQAVNDKSQAIGEFIEWLGEQEIYLEPTEELLARFFDIDLKKVEQERRAILEQLRKNPPKRITQT